MRDDACIGCPGVFTKCDADDVESAPGNKVQGKVVDHAYCLEDAFGSGRDASGLGGGVERVCEGALDGEEEKVRGRRGRVRCEVALTGRAVWPGDAVLALAAATVAPEERAASSRVAMKRPEEWERMPSRVELSSGRGGW